MCKGEYMNLSDILFSFDGRINRKTFLTFFIPILVICFLFGLGYKPWNIWRYLIVIILFWPGLALQIKRWHDRNKSGYWILINFIPIIGVIWVTIELFFLPGTKGKNRFDKTYIEAPVVNGGHLTRNDHDSILTCDICDFTVTSSKFRENELLCPQCGSRLKEK
jgi:uncharacterized membrane protein YhaH (DUF805 family)